MKKLKFIILLALTFILFSCEKNTAPTCEITAPSDNAVLIKGETVTIDVEAFDADDNFKEVRFYIDNASVGSTSSFPFSYSWNTTNTSEGLHTIKATAIDEEGEEGSYSIRVAIGTSPEADFTANQTNVELGTNISFTEQPTGNPTAWNWDFGDSSISTDQNPSHTYNAEGSYTVELTVTNNYGSYTKIKTKYITVLSIGAIGSGLTDIDGNTYASIIINGQEWMAENLKVTHYPNGDAIPLVTNNTAWGDLDNDNTSDAYCYYNNNASSEASTYGALYTYAAAIGDDWHRDNSSINAEGGQGICPDGWHLPTDEEWNSLETYLGTNAGSKLAGNAALWTDGNLDQNSDFGISGFSALPGGGGSGSDAGTFNGLKNYGYWWGAAEDGWGSANVHYLYYDNATLRNYDYGKSNGLSVRCIRD